MDNKAIKVNPNCHSLVLGRPIVEMGGEFYASYSKICATCGARHGQPGTWLTLERCNKCSKSKLERNKIDGAVKKTRKRDHDNPDKFKKST